VRARGPQNPATGPESSRSGDPQRPPAEAEHFYADILRELLAAGFRFLVGGGYAVYAYTEARLPTKDLDVFMMADEFPRVLAHLQHAGYRVSVTDERWLGKVHRGEYFVDLIFGSSNDIVPVQEEWFRYARDAQVLGLSVPLISPTELIWSKAFVQKRFRHDGSDIIHVILKQADEIDWRRLIAQMDAHWEVLLGHILSFRWVYPSERDAIPRWLLDELLERLNRQRELPAQQARICRGRLLSRSDYRSAIEEWGYLDIEGVACDDE
jgi:hypothetical protein